MADSPAAVPKREPSDIPSFQSVLRVTLTVVTVAAVLYLIYRLRTPISWFGIAAFVAVALSGPVNFVSRFMRKGLAIALVYLTVVLIPVGLAALILVPLVRDGVNLAQEAPKYVDDLQKEVNKNDTLRKANQDLGLTEKLQDFASDLPSKVGDAAGALVSIGSGIVSSAFALFTIVVLSIFMVANGRTWIESFVRWRTPEHAPRIERALQRMANAIGNYVGGALVQATLAGISGFIMLKILGVPFAGALAVVMAFGDLIPMVGATIAAVLIGIVTLFTDFPVATIVWTIFAIAYQQFENYVVQPQIQKRAVELQPFLVIVSVLLFGSLLGVIGAILAIPLAASIQIGVREYRAYNAERRIADGAVQLSPPRAGGATDPPVG